MMLVEGTFDLLCHWQLVTAVMTASNLEVTLIVVSLVLVSKVARCGREGRSLYKLYSA